MKNLFKNMNTTPVKTKNWLNINDISIEESSIPKRDDFDNVTITNGDTKGISIKKLSKMDIYPEVKFSYGINDMVVYQALEDYNQGIFINIDNKVKVKEPIIIEFKFNSSNRYLVDNIVIIANEHSEARIIIKYSFEDNDYYYHNGICKIIAKQNSKVSVTKINLLNSEAVHLDSNLSNIDNSGSVKFVSVDIGGKYSITNYHADLLSDNASSSLKSIYLGTEDKVIDINYIMTHRGRYTSSEILTKGALMDRS
ncbi:MAG: SufD family Fe-S cluster assembly protein, partial [Clostridium sp.]